MTIPQPVIAAPQVQPLLPMPDPPERRPEERSGFNHLNRTYLLTKYFGYPDTTLVAGEHYVAPFPTRDMAGVKFPDLMIAFDVDPEAYKRSNAYIISEQGKPPDFVLEIASRATGHLDVGEKRDAYAALGIPEYWRFDDTGRHHGARLAGDRFEHGTYRPIAIEEPAAEVLQGYSEVLNLHLRWGYGELGWYDPATGRHIPTYDDQGHPRRSSRACLRPKNAPTSGKRAPANWRNSSDAGGLDRTVASKAVKAGTDAILCYPPASLGPGNRKSSGDPCVKIRSRRCRSSPGTAHRSGFPVSFPIYPRAHGRNPAPVCKRHQRPGCRTRDHRDDAGVAAGPQQG